MCRVTYVSRDVCVSRYVRYSDCPPFDAGFREAEWSSQADGAQGQQLQILWQPQALQQLRAAIAGGCMRFVTSEQVHGDVECYYERGHRAALITLRVT